MAAASQSLFKRWQPGLIWALYGLGLLPAVWAFYQGATGGLGADPVKSFEKTLGLWALRLLILTLAVTPLRELFRINLIAYRRALGLLCFYYVAFHLTVYMVLDQALDLAVVLQDVLKRPFIMFGMAAFVMLVPLAVTSNRLSIRKLGRNWTLLHRLIYLAAASALLHYALSTKVLSPEQAIYIGLILILLLYRAARPLIPRKRNAKPAPGSQTARVVKQA
ncbi:sulfoxide reductase heme-binding subunit YedZ [Xaviernesmea oryzae]|uniref:Protein-methionine-sulfoxide reductase heme-binding subunit MsrQ n=1 Tax=Xaviernesmea oryzae TaxID=464029 RepID=A0A1Q9AQV0_9HYPH|nr:protein-methionine-sulfoxide reductase heme-binding subunit MsrQ [Xaviernesmea oryzae]OLP57813.1 sulfoxide reductase heme-binding subunit YedZ [Xaviernesmea oryzae]SEL35911.1 sulfoxide reductase heme-binding subunit YedZ [Xaviernesmea oryzae]